MLQAQQHVPLLIRVRPLHRCMMCSTIWLLLRYFAPLCPELAYFADFFPETELFHNHYHLQVQANPQKNCTKKPMLFLASLGETGLTHDIFFQFSLRPFEVVEAEGGRLVKEADFEAEIFFYPSENPKKSHGLIPFFP